MSERPGKRESGKEKEINKFKKKTQQLATVSCQLQQLTVANC